MPGRGLKNKELGKAQVNGNLDSKTPSSPITEKCQGVCSSFICWRSTMIRKKLPKDPHKAVEVLKHVGSGVQRC